MIIVLLFRWHFFLTQKYSDRTRVDTCKRNVLVRILAIVNLEEPNIVLVR